MKQPSLFDNAPGLARIDHTATAKEAASAINLGSGTLREAVYGFIRDRGGYGATDQEIQENLQMDPSTERPRRVELVNAGAVKDSGRTRKTTSGRDAVVWEAVTQAAEPCRAAARNGRSILSHNESQKSPDET